MYTLYFIIKKNIIIYITILMVLFFFADIILTCAFRITGWTLYKAYNAIKPQSPQDMNDNDDVYIILTQMEYESLRAHAAPISEK